MDSGRLDFDMEKTTQEDNQPIVINGKRYPLWEQFVHGKAKYIGKKLQDFGDALDRFALGAPELAETKIIDITLTPNGTDSAVFSVEGEEFGCSFDVQHGGVTGGEKGWLTFAGYGGHAWRIQT